jgi:hypothetical protein
MTRRETSWRHRKRWWLAALLVTMAVAAALLAVAARDLRPLLRWAGARAGAVVSADEARLGWGVLRVRNLSVTQPGRAEYFAQIDFAEAAWSWTGLLRGHIRSVNLQGPKLSLKRLEEFQRARPAAPAQPRANSGANSGAKTVGGPRLTIETLVVRDGRLELDNLGAGLPSVPIDLAAVDPIVLNNLRLGAAGGAEEEAQTVVVENVVVHSPYDPLTAVLKFEQIALAFSWEGIQQQRLKSLTVKNPTVYIGPDLFYFADQVQAAQQAASPTAAAADRAPAAPWTIDYFRLTGGRLVVYSFGKPGFPLPMVFAAESEHMVLDNFAKLPFNKLGFDIPSTDLAYPALGLKVVNLSGSLFVGLPPKDDQAKNLVPVLAIEELDWKGVTAKKLYVSMTFDRSTVFAEFGGEAEGGYLNGGVYVNLADFSWTGWGSADRVTLDRVTRLLSPENFLINGRASGEFVVRGQVSEVTGLGGKLTLPDAGQIRIVSVDEMLQKLPGDWWQPKREAVKALLESFRDYDYAGGGVEFTVAPPESFLRLSVDGRQGKRKFDLRWHDRRAEPRLKY